MTIQNLACRFLIHSWEKWGKREPMEITYASIFNQESVKLQYVQERNCLNCNKIQFRTVGEFS